MRYTVCLTLLAAFAINPAFAGDKKSPCRGKKDAAKTTVAQTDKVEKSDEPPRDPGVSELDIGRLQGNSIKVKALGF